jgi:hypothetical protein
MASRYDFSDRENLAIRAVLCTLMTDPIESDIEQTTEWFLNFSDKVENHSEEIQDLLQRHFG